MNIDVSVIIVNFRTSRLVADAVASIYRETHDATFEVIVVDNNSGDDSEAFLTDRFAGKKNFRYVSLKENVGFGRANNHGFRLARGRNLFCLNPDTVLLNDAISILSRYLDSHPDCGACGANLFGPSMQEVLSYRRVLPGVRWELNSFLHDWLFRLFYGRNRTFNHTGRPLKVGYITGADLMMPRHVVEETSGYAPEFFMYYEDTDLCARIRRAGYRVMSVPEARIQHLEGGSFEKQKVNLRKLDMLEKGRKLFYERNVGTLRRSIAGFIYLSLLYTRRYITGSEIHKAKLECHKKVR